MDRHDRSRQSSGKRAEKRRALRGFLEEARAEQLSRADRLHGLVYSIFPYLYIAIGTGEHRLAPVFQRIARLWSALTPRLSPARRQTRAQQAGPAEGYHGKVVPLELAAELVSVKEDIELRNLEQIIPFRKARDIVLKNPERIIALDCPCRAARENPCTPLGVCLVVGEPFASLIASRHAERTRWISQQEAVQILSDEQRRGHVSHAYFKDAMLDRFYAICNCCSCCCGAMQAVRGGTPMIISSGYLAQIDAQRCIGCETCAPLCQFEALALVDGWMQVDPGRCMGCGVCGAACDQAAIELMRDPGRPEPLMITRLLPIAVQLDAPVSGAEVR